MFLKWLSMACVQPKLEHPITQAQKYGREKNTHQSVTFGRLDVFYIKCVH